MEITELIFKMTFDEIPFYFIIVFIIPAPFVFPSENIQIVSNVLKHYPQ